MYLYLLPPLSLVVAVLAYLFQSRAADLRMEHAQPEDGRVVRVFRGAVHALVVCVCGVGSPFGAAIAVNAIVPNTDPYPLRDLPRDVYLWIGTVASFTLAVTCADRTVEALISRLVGPGTSGALRVRDVLRLELPDIVLLQCVMVFYVWA